MFMTGLVSGNRAETPEVTTSVERDGVAFIEVSRPPHNYFDAALIGALADALDSADQRADVRVVVLCSSGRTFSGGVDIASTTASNVDAMAIYREGARLFDTRKPLIAAIQGAAVGGGLGLALAADFRVAAPEARFCANFARLGLHHGFGLSVTLPAVVGQQVALDLLFTGRRVDGEEARQVGLCDRLVPTDKLRSGAQAFAVEIASSAPLAVRAIRKTLRGNLAERVRGAMNAERSAQARLHGTADATEGLHALVEHRPPRFTGS